MNRLGESRYKGPAYVEPASMVCYECSALRVEIARLRAEVATLQAAGVQYVETRPAITRTTTVTRKATRRKTKLDLSDAACMERYQWAVMPPPLHDVLKRLIQGNPGVCKAEPHCDWCGTAMAFSKLDGDRKCEGCSKKIYQLSDVWAIVNEQKQTYTEAREAKR